MGLAAFKTLSWSLIWFFFISGSGGKGSLWTEVYVCVWLTCYGWYCFGLILTPTPAPFCLLLQAVSLAHTGKCFFFVFPPSLSSHFFLFFKLNSFCSLCGSDTHSHSHLTLIAKLTGSCFIFHVVVSWQSVSWSAPDSLWWHHDWCCQHHTVEAVCVHVCVVCVSFIMNGFHSLSSYLLISTSALRAEEKMISLSISSMWPWKKKAYRKLKSNLIC